MFGRNKKVTFNPHDTHYRRMWLNLQDIEMVLSNRVKESYVLNACIDIYPEGADKEKAIADSEKAKYSLLCTIGSYDDTKNELQNFYKANKDKLEKCATWDPSQFSDSHALIEIYVENLIKRV